jgi:hypothetical protein
MRKIYHHISLSLIFAALFAAIACDVRGGAAETPNNISANKEIAAQAQGENNSAAKNENDSAENAAQITAASVAGTYKFETYNANKRQGYANTLAVEAGTGGKVNVYFDATYAYPVSDRDETFKTASGGGDLTLRGNRASGAISEEGDEESGAKCRVTITFAANRATVAAAEDCNFNVAIDGVYTKEKSKSAAPKTATPREIKFEELRDFVNDFDKNKTGERFVITEVPPDTVADLQRADAQGNQSYKGFFYLVAPEDAESAGFITTPPLLRELQANNDREPASLRVTAVLVQSDGKFDVYRLSFVTKIEALDADGETVWTATGEQPPKVKFRH